MGLLDKLAERAMDEATASRRSAAAERDDFRRSVVSVLEVYGADIEALRIALHRVRDALLAGTPEDVGEVEGRGGVVFPVLDIENAVIYTRLQELMPELFELDVEPALRHQALVYFNDDISWKEPLKRAFDRMDEANIALEQEWARVRPLLDDLLARDGVVFLRAVRHQLRDIMIRTADLIRRVNWSDSRSRRTAVESIEDSLVVTDEWATHISAIRRAARDRRVIPSEG